VYSQHAVPVGVVEAVGAVASGTIAEGVVGGLLFTANATVSDDNGSAGKTPSLFWTPSVLRGNTILVNCKSIVVPFEVIVRDPSPLLRVIAPNWVDKPTGEDLTIVKDILIREERFYGILLGI